MAAFLPPDISSGYPAMGKCILSAEGNYEVRLILLVIQSSLVPCLASLLSDLEDFVYKGFHNLSSIIHPLDKKNNTPSVSKISLQLQLTTSK